MFNGSRSTQHSPRFSTVFYSSFDRPSSRVALPLSTNRVPGRPSVGNRADALGRPIAAKFTLDPTTNELGYAVSATGFADGEILAVTMHRKGKDENGPVIAVLTNHPFKSLVGASTLSDPDREKLMAGGLYLRITTRSAPMRIVIKPEGVK